MDLLWTFGVSLYEEHIKSEDSQTNRFRILLKNLNHFLKKWFLELIWAADNPHLNFSMFLKIKNFFIKGIWQFPDNFFSFFVDFTMMVAKTGISTMPLEAIEMEVLTFVVSVKN